MTAFHCQHPDHEGNRLIRKRTEQYTKRITYRRMDGDRRLYEHVIGYLCLDCVHHDNKATEDNHPELMFGPVVT